MGKWLLLSINLLSITNIVLSATCNGRTTYNIGIRACEKKIIFEDDFNAKDIYGKWRHVVRFSDFPDYEFNMYERSKNILYLKNGLLNIQPSIMLNKRGDEFFKNGEIDLNAYPPKNAYCTLKPDNPLCYKKATGSQILPPIISGRITSRFRFRYGSIEIRARVPQGDWIYPQIELTPPSGNSRYGKKAAVIVIAMVRGNEELKMSDYDPRLNFGLNWLEAGIFPSTYAPLESASMVAMVNSTGWNKEFHTFRLEWSPTELRFFVDGTPIGKGVVPTNGILGKGFSAAAPGDEEMEIALGVGVGGIQRFPDNIQSSGITKPWRNNSPKALLNFYRNKKAWLPTWKGINSALQVDYVRVWSMDSE